jgi:transposase
VRVESILCLLFVIRVELSEEQLSELRNEAGKGSFAIAKDVKHDIKQNFGIEYNLSHVQLCLKKTLIIL